MAHRLKMATAKAPVQGITRPSGESTSGVGGVVGVVVLDGTDAGPHGPATVEMPDFSGMFQPSTTNLYFETLYNPGDPMISAATTPSFHAGPSAAAVHASKRQHGDKHRPGTTQRYDYENVRLGANGNGQSGTSPRAPSSAPVKLEPVTRTATLASFSTSFTHLSSSKPPRTHRMICLLLSCPYMSHADWCLQSDVVPVSRLSTWD